MHTRSAPAASALGKRSGFSPETNSIERGAWCGMRSLPRGLAVPPPLRRICPDKCRDASFRRQLRRRPGTTQGADMSGPPSSMTRALLLNAQRPVDLHTRRRAVLHWLDWIGCVAAGCRAPVGAVLRRLQPLAGATESLIGPAADGWQATLFDAAPANVEEMDDMHRQAILHPGPVVRSEEHTSELQ